MISLMMPYSSHNVFLSRASTREHVSLWERRPVTLSSRLSHLASHLAGNIRDMSIRGRDCSPGAPTLHNTCQQDLLRVICNVRTNSVNCTSIVPISIMDQIWCLHVL